MPPLRTAPAAALLLALVLAACTPAPPPPAAAPRAAGTTTVFVVRHAERASETDRDPDLSAAGQARAAALAETLADAGVVGVFATEYRRTQQTAAPLAARLGVPVQRYDGADPASIARTVRDRYSGVPVLLVGHSNTVRSLVRALGGTADGDLASHEYDDLYIVLIPPSGPVHTVHARYGAPNPG